MNLIGFDVYIKNMESKTLQVLKFLFFQKNSNAFKKLKKLKTFDFFQKVDRNLKIFKIPAQN